MYNVVNTVQYSTIARLYRPVLDNVQCSEYSIVQYSTVLLPPWALDNSVALGKVRHTVSREDKEPGSLEQGAGSRERTKKTLKNVDTNNEKFKYRKSEGQNINIHKIITSNNIIQKNIIIANIK